MEYNKTKPVSSNSCLCGLISNNALVCFEYKLNLSNDDNNFNYGKDVCTMMDKKNHIQAMISPVKNNLIISNDKDYVYFNEKRNYVEEEIQANHNKKQLLMNKSK